MYNSFSIHLYFKFKSDVHKTFHLIKFYIWGFISNTEVIFRLLFSRTYDNSLLEYIVVLILTISMILIIDPKFTLISKVKFLNI